MQSSRFEKFSSGNIPGPMITVTGVRSRGEVELREEKRSDHGRSNSAWARGFPCA